jgi:hypothetical protein
MKTHTTEPQPKMIESRGERKQRYKGRNKRNGKKPAYHSYKNKCRAHRLIRHYMKSYINANEGNLERIEDITFPQSYKKTGDWWDVYSSMPTVFKLKNF